jgi:ketosteroid isomerase-like protein
MKKVALFLTGITLFTSASLMVSAQTAATPVVTKVADVTVDRTADHNTLRAMLIDAEKAINEGRFNDLEKYLDPNVTVVYQNAEVADGLAETKAFQERIFNKSNGVLKGISSKVTADKLTKFYGDTAIAYGTSLDHYSFVGGLEMDLTSKWTTTLVKENGQWKVVSLTFTSNLFDNPLLTNAKASAKYFGFGGLVVGLLIGFFGVRFFRKKK